MKQRDFEARVLQIWLRSRVSLTVTHVQHLTGASRRETTKGLEEMVANGSLDCEVSSEGDLVYTVRGAVRPEVGPETIDELERVGRLEKEVSRSALKKRPKSEALDALGPRGTKQVAVQAASRDEKSVVASAALSLVLGPLGWLYAAPLRESVPGLVGVALVYALVPRFLLVPFLTVLGPLSALAGAYYAIRYNQSGKRTGLFSDGPGDEA